MENKKTSLADAGLPIGLRIRVHRLLLGLKQFEVARLCGTSPSTLSTIELGTYGRKISPRLASKLSMILEIDLSELLEE